MERRDAVVFLEIGRFGSDLRRVELDLFWIFFGLNLDETVRLVVSPLRPNRLTI
jgi:hypothetical protein